MLVATTELTWRVTGPSRPRASASASSCAAAGLGGNIMAGLRSIVGGEIKEYTVLIEEARRHAIDRMVESATAMGANAVVMMRFDSSEMGQTMSEIVAYGTAVVIRACRSPFAFGTAVVIEPVKADAPMPVVRIIVGALGIVAPRHGRADGSAWRAGPARPCGFSALGWC